MTHTTTMTDTGTEVLSTTASDLAREKAAALAEIERSKAEVARLAKLIPSAEHAVNLAEARAADAVTAANLNAADEAEVMAAVGAARARRDAIVTAHRRAIQVKDQAHAALKPLGFREKRAEARAYFSKVVESARRVDVALRILAEEIPVMKQAYRAGVSAVWGSHEWVDGAGPHLPGDLNLAPRMNSILFHSLKEHFFGQASGASVSMCAEPTLAANLANILAVSIPTEDIGSAAHGNESDAGKPLS